MLKIYANNTDITSAVEFGSLQTTEQLNNRRNTAKFRVTGTTIDEAQEVEIYKGSILKGSSAGSTVIPVDETFQNAGFYYTGLEVRLGFKTALEEIAVVSSVDHTAKTITLVSSTRYSHSAGDLLGVKIFGGVTLKNPTEQIGYSGVLSYQVDAVDYSSIFDNKNVVDTYADQYAREIIGRVVYNFTADDSKTDLNECESIAGITTSGTAITPTLDSSDFIYKNYSINLGSSGAGTATYRIPITWSPADLTAFDKLRLWIKEPEFPKDSVSSIKIRIIDGTGKAFEWIDTVLEGPGWSYDSFDFLRASWIGGTPSKTTATYIEVELVALKAITLGSFKIDHIFAGKKGFTIKGTQRGNVLFKDVRAQYKKPTVFTESLAKNNGFFWYITSERDLVFFSSEARPAPISITPTSLNYGKLKITADITNLKNRITVRGGRAPQETLYEQIKVLDGQETSYRLDYPPKDLSIYVDTGAGYVLKTSGIENLVADTSVDFVFNFNEKTVRNGAQALLAAGSKIKLVYYPYKDIRVQVRDAVSITTMQALLWGDGIYDGAVINDSSILTFDEARARAKAELKAYSNPIISATFETEVDGLEAGQNISIEDTTYGINSTFVIQKLDKKQKDFSGNFTYSVSCGSTMYGLTEFLQFLLKKTENGVIDASDIVDVVEGIDETLIIIDAWINTIKPNIFYAMPDLTENLEAYYPFNWNSNDESGNGYNLTNANAILTTDEFWNINSAYEFNGINANLQKTSFWLSSRVIQTQVFRFFPTVNDGVIFGYGTHNTVRILANWKIQVEILWSTGRRISTADTVILNQWNTVIIRYNVDMIVGTPRLITDIDIFLNSVKQILSSTSIGGSSGTITTINLGSYNNTISFFAGKISLAKIYAKAANDIEALAYYKDSIGFIPSLTASYTDNDAYADFSEAS